jgi:hypothetical protein
MVYGFSSMLRRDTYVQAGYQANRGNAARMNANESIQKLVEELVGLPLRRPA